MRLRVWILCIVAMGCVIASIAGCQREYAMERALNIRGTLGQELFNIWRKDAQRAATNAESKVAMLDENQQRFVGAVDTIAPVDELRTIDHFLHQSLVLVDQGLLSDLTRKVQVALNQASRDELLLATLSTSYKPSPDSFISATHTPNFLGHATAYPHLAALSQDSARLILRLDGLDANGHQTIEESASIADLLRSWKQSIDTPESIAPGDRVAILLRDILLSEDVRFATDSPDQPPLYAALFDERGFPLVSDHGGQLVVPFVDETGDGLADVDVRGHFKLVNGSYAFIPAFPKPDHVDMHVGRDVYGRALGADGKPVFSYVDLNQTGLMYLLNIFPDLARRDLLYHAVEASPALFGPKEVHADQYGNYPGYSSNYAMLDVIWGLLHTLDFPLLPELLDNTAKFLDRAHLALASLINSFDHIDQAFEKAPHAHLKENQTLLYDLLPIIHEVAGDKALWNDVMEALREPISRRTGEAMGTLLSYKDTRAVPEADGPYDACFQRCKGLYTIGTEARFDCIRACPTHEIFSVPMDFSQPETESNRSMHQRLFHLLRDTAGTPYTMNVEESRLPGGMSLPANMPPMLHLPDSAGAFMRSVAGHLHLADYISDDFHESDLGQLLELLDSLLPGNLGNETIAGVLSRMSGLFGARLDVMPTPDQITRLFNQQDLRFQTDNGSIVLAVSNPVCRDGYVMAQHHADGLYAAEAAGLIDTMYPLARAFSAHGRESLLGEIFTIVHEHYSSRADIYYTAHGIPSFMKGSNLVSFEPALLEIYKGGQLFDALYELTHAMVEPKPTGGVDLQEALRQMVYHATLPDPKVRGRRGESYLELGDGRTLMPLSRIHLLLLGFDELAESIPSDSPTRHHMETFSKGLIEGVLPLDVAEDGKASFTDHGAIALGALGTRFMANKARELRDRGELSQWLVIDQMQNIEEFWRSRALGALTHIGYEAMKNEQERMRMNDFVVHLLDSPQASEQAAITVFFLLIQSLNTETNVPVTRFLANLLDPDRVWDTSPHGHLPLLTQLALILDQMAELDPEGVGLKLIHRGVHRENGQPMAFSVLGDVITSYFKVDPASTSDWTEEDYRQAFQGFARWLGDDRYGLEQFYNVVDMRRR